MALPPILNKQIGPFKLWVWGALVGAGVGAGVLWRAFGSTQRPAPTEEDKAPPPVIATEPVGYVFADEGDGDVRIDRPQLPNIPAPPPLNTPLPQPVPSPRPPGTPQVPAQPNIATVSGFRAVRSGANLMITWNAPVAPLRVQIDDVSSAPVMLFRSGAGETTRTIPAQNRAYKLSAKTFDTANKFSAPVFVSVPAATTQPNEGGTKSYPGLAAGFVMDCQTADHGHIVSDLSQVETSGSTTARARKLSAWALTNTGSPSYPNYGVIFHNGVHTAGVREASNRDRVRYGLFPLTNAEWDAVEADMKSMLPRGGLDERNSIYQSGEYARRLFAKYNLPYQCRAGSVRTARVSASTLEKQANDNAR